MINLNPYLFIICTISYMALAAWILRKSRHTLNLALAACCGMTAFWSGSSIASNQLPMEQFIGLMDLLRIGSWYYYLLLLYRRTEIDARWQTTGFTIVLFIALFLSLFYFITASDIHYYTLYSLPVSIRLMLCIFELLLIENLYLNLPENARWHIAIPCVLLGALACFDILVSADSVLFLSPSTSLISARIIAIIIVAPLLILAALRGQRWSKPIRLSRAAVFHSATLVLSGSVLLALALAGEVLRRFDESLGWIAELSLVFAGIIGTLLFLSSRSARSIIQRVVTRHFFADRYDYRLEWLECIGTLSGTKTIERTSLSHRAIRAVADVVNSPNGALFLLDQTSGSMFWAGSWNMPSATNLDTSNHLVRLSVASAQIIEFKHKDPVEGEDDFTKQLGPLWLAVPLRQSGTTIGIVVVGPPRVSFRLDQEVFDLLGIVGQQVATYIAEQRATEVVLQTRNLHDYGKRFAFVAHDIKNISSQLAILLSNAQIHIENPEFQHDMLETVRASVSKIDGLLKRLDKPETRQAPASITPLPRIEALIVAYERVRQATITITHDGSIGAVAMSPDAFDTAITHILNNALEAAPGRPVKLVIHHEARQVVIDIIDRGPGMSPEFIRENLFAPFSTGKEAGSGIGAFQAKELIEEAGGQLFVSSEERVGTKMSIVLRRSDLISQQWDGPTPENATGE